MRTDLDRLAEQRHKILLAKKKSWGHGSSGSVLFA
jgi:hypothetical protein